MTLVIRPRCITVQPSATGGNKFYHSHTSTTIIAIFSKRILYSLSTCKSSYDNFSTRLPTRGLTAHQHNMGIANSDSFKRSFTHFYTRVSPRNTRTNRWAALQFSRVRVPLKSRDRPVPHQSVFNKYPHSLYCTVNRSEYFLNPYR